MSNELTTEPTLAYKRGGNILCQFKPPFWSVSADEPLQVSVQDMYPPRALLAMKLTLAEDPNQRASARKVLSLSSSQRCEAIVQGTVQLERCQLHHWDMMLHALPGRWQKQRLRAETR